MFRLSIAMMLFLTLALSGKSAEPTVIKLWPGKAPGETKDIGSEKTIEPKPGQREVKRVTDVSEPTIAIYSPPKEKNTKVAVVVAPGGGYSILAIEHEGTQVCEWLNTLGVTAVLLKYRVPKREMQLPENLAALQDAQRAIGLVRSKAADLDIDTKKVGMLGFSAGGNLTVSTCLAEKRYYSAIDKTDETFSRIPNFALLIYPAYLVDEKGELKAEYKVTKESPPMFFAHSSDDPITSENSVSMYLALKKNNVPAELHLYATGEHGYGISKVPHPCASWPDRAADWMKTRGLLDASATGESRGGKK
jgi:acetyl esterase/lipase